MTHATITEGNIEISTGTGTGALAESIAALAVGRHRLASVAIHLSTAPSSAGAVTITLNSAAGQHPELRRRYGLHLDTYEPDIHGKRGRN